FQAARELLADTGWTACYPLTLAVNLGLADALRLAGDVAGAQTLAQEVEGHARTALDRVGVYGLRAHLLINELRLADGGRLVLATAADLGHPVPVPTGPEDLFARLGATMNRVMALGPAGVQALENATDPAVVATSQVLGSGLPAMAMGLREMHPSAALHVVDLTLSHGVAPGSAAAFSHLGIMLCASGQYDAGWLVGQMSEALRRRDVPQGLTGGLVEYLAFIHHWKQPFTRTAVELAAGARRALELGDPNVYGYCANTRYMVRLLAGESLDRMDADFAPTVTGLLHHGQDLAAISAGIWGQVVANLRAGGEHAARLEGARFDAPTMRPIVAQAPPVITAYMACAEALLGLVFSEPAHALAALDAAAETLADPAVAPAVAFPAAVTYRAVAVAAAAAAAQGEARDALLARLEADLGLLAAFAETAPANHMHRLLWARAERAALAGDVGGAMDGYGRAAHTAQTAGFVHDEALIQHRAALFHLVAGRVVPARGHLREAVRALREWGAAGAADALWQAHADVLGAQQEVVAGPTLDVGAVLAANEALGAARDLDGLLAALMRIVIENAAAERGVLVLDREGELLVAAEARPEATEVMQAVALDHFAGVPLDLVHYVARTGETVVCEDAADSRFAGSPDVQARGVRSVLCVALVHQGGRLGVLYLENNLASGVFTEARARLVQALARQGATALQNAILLKAAREAAERLAIQNRQLTHVDRLREEFLAKTSHELRTPLNGIIGLARSLLDGAQGELRPGVTQNLDMIVSSGRRLASLINDILDFSALREDALTVHLAPVEAVGVVDRAVAILRPLLDAKRLAVRDTLPGDLPLVLADEDRLEQVLLNLLGNAAKFTDEGQITVRAQVEGERIRFEVTDTGPGIDAGLHERIFQAFDQGDADVDTARGGTGLGLPIARQLVEAQGGQIGVRSVPGQGSTFWYTLPVAQGVDHLAARTPRRSVKPAGKPQTVVLEPVGDQPRPGDGARILVVDDEPVNLQVVLQHLQPQGFTVHTALGGRAALDRLNGGLEVDAIILDVMMPDLDGLAVTEAIRQTRHGVALPILLLTAKNQTGDLIAGLGAGANDYVTKPVDGPELIARLRTHLTLSRFNRAADRFVPHAFMQALGRDSLTEVQPGDAKAQRMTVLFADMHGFGALTRGWDPTDSFRFVNRWLSVLEPPITRHGGFVDKYMGDSVMALFPGAFTDAVAAAVDMQRAVAEFNEARRAVGRAPVHLGVGVHTGELVLGAVGNQRRLDTTVISDAVNAASALEARTKRLRAGVLVAGEAEPVLRAAGHRMRHIDEIHGQPVFEIYDADPQGAVAAKEATRPIFERAVRAFHDRAFGEAERLFQVCRALDPADPAARDYAERCERVRRSIEGGGV
ncbi:MAG: response regulator, partial [Myxococcales bacterium]|nr:response regulator [Myxococcales bacterium]